MKYPEAFAAGSPEADLAGTNLSVVPTTDERFGDFQCNAAMALAKALRRKPRDLAQAVVARGAFPACVERADVAGPGFVSHRIAQLRPLTPSASAPFLLVSGGRCSLGWLEYRRGRLEHHLPRCR